MSRKSFLVPAWEVVRTIELEPFSVELESHDDFQRDDAALLHYRIEIMRSLSSGNEYRARLFRDEMMRLTPTFPQEPDQYEPIQHLDEVVWIEDSDVEGMDFIAPSAEDALQTCLALVEAYWQEPAV